VNPFAIQRREWYNPFNNRLTPRETHKMPEGKIKKLTDRGFGFIKTDSSKDLFFHSNSLQGVRYEELSEGQKVSYTEGQGPKGPCAENVKLV
jgi:CspA family cold shock protein